MPAQTFHPNPGAPTLHVPEDVEYDDEEVIAEEEARKAAMHARMKEKMKEDIAALLDGEDLSEEFVQKATTIFEAAVIARAEEIVASVEEELTEQFEVAIEEVKEELASKIDDYMNYMAEPARLERRTVGFYVLMVLGLLLVLVYALKKSYWKDLH